ncbi:NAD-dependent epimerase/dehydratase [Halodesulfurarchaeum formicicum]|uniref:NAD-dependent epimerase/dehydratase n=1 Tax=Halodesulfurarchaeum formicicum TaxID=1873524 RepID=A0A1D8S711_9EURY|nr:complex I NDUFA9 subunit family protein [Halodesulfurarchaeum formicicum]AOW81135.1 NAD-dependent epimerase/dehydratase [Halodesulfurarchaeum formicicum]
MKVLVTGGSGFVGTHLSRELASRGHEVTALSRSPDGEELPDAVETVSGDVTEYESLVDPIEGQDVVVNLVALSPLFKPKGGDEMHRKIHLEGTRNVVRAAEAGDVSAIVQMSALGADPEGATAYIRAKGRAETVVRESDLEWTIVRPSVIFGDGSEFLQFTRTLTTPYVTALPAGGSTRFQPIWIGDLAPMLADCVESAEHRGQTYDIGGPEALSLADVARLLYEAEGKSLSVIPVPMSLTEIGMNLADPISFVPFGRDQYRSLQFDNTTAENDISAFGLEPADLLSLAEYIEST